MGVCGNSRASDKVAQAVKPPSPRNNCNGSEAASRMLIGQPVAFVPPYPGSVRSLSSSAIRAGE